MNLSEISKKVGTFASKNSNTILCVTATAGVVSTAYFSAKAGWKANDKLRELELTLGRKLSNKEKVKYLWDLYIPAAASGLVTIGAVAGSSHINNKRTVALTTAYSITEKAFNEYKEKVVQTIGEKKEKKLTEELIAEKSVNNPPNNNVLLVGSGDILCYETHTGRYFLSDMESLRRAQNDINSKLISHMEATLSDFYYILGLPSTSASSYTGWTSDKMLNLVFSSVLHEGKPCLAFDYNYTKML